MKVSVVTACFNAVRTLPETIRSVAAQRGIEVEHIVIDGGSTDGTTALLTAESGIRWLSEPDHGLYDALNKGLALATGDIVGILNADDVFASDDVLATVAAAFADVQLDATYADVRFVRTPGGPVVRYCTGRHFRKWMFRFATFPAHPSFFMRRALFERYGGYSLDYRICADFEYLLRLMLRHGIRTRYLPICTTEMRLGGLSTSGLRANIEINREDLRALKANGYWSCLPLLYLKYPFKLTGFLRRS